ncbi:MAG: mandelate racemase/muconate lactonizing enzyme family protein [Verrucomicrobiota bacterium]
MKISRLYAKQIDYHMGNKVWNPKIQFPTKEVIIVFIETDTGHIGVGEIWAFYGSSRSIIEIIKQDIAPIVEGEDPTFIERIHALVGGLAPIGSIEGILMNALSGIDLALWDLQGKVHNSPLYKLLGPLRDKVYTYASGGLYGHDKTQADLQAETKGYIDEGFDAVKIKIGGLSQEEDIARVAATREAIGASAKLMVDAVHAYDVPQALRIAEKIRPYDIYWFESPVALSDVAGHGILNTRGGIPVCANESLYGLSSYFDLMKVRGAEYIHFDLTVCGGITMAKKIAALAEAYDLKCTLHAANGIHLFQTSIHFAAAIPNVESVEYHHVHQWMRDSAPSEAMAHQNGYVRPLEASGIGTHFITPEFVDQQIAAQKEISESQR